MSCSDRSGLDYGRNHEHIVESTQFWRQHRPVDFIWFWYQNLIGVTKAFYKKQGIILTEYFTNPFWSLQRQTSRIMDSAPTTEVSWSGRNSESSFGTVRHWRRSVNSVGNQCIFGEKNDVFFGVGCHPFIGTCRKGPKCCSGNLPLLGRRTRAFRSAKGCGFTWLDFCWASPRSKVDAGLKDVIIFQKQLYVITYIVITYIYIWFRSWTFMVQKELQFGISVGKHNGLCGEDSIVQCHKVVAKQVAKWWTPWLLPIWPNFSHWALRFHVCYWQGWWLGCWMSSVCLAWNWSQCRPILRPLDPQPHSSRVIPDYQGQQCLRKRGAMNRNEVLDLRTHLSYLHLAQVRKELALLLKQHFATWPINALEQNCSTWTLWQELLTHIQKVHIQWIFI